jgi:tetratricopeptide (TPR) repeat protein
MLRIGLAFSETSGLDASQLSQWIEDSEGLPGRLHARFLEKLLGMPLEEFLQTSDSFEAQILLLAAASGNSVTAGDIREIAGEDGVSVLRQWGRHGLLTPTQIHEFGEAGFAFDAGRYHRQLAKLRRKDIHQAYHEHLLNALRLRLSPDSLSLSPRILGHQVGVGDLDNSLRTATAIANHALTMGAFPEAIRCAKRVVQTLTKRADRRWLNNPEVQLFVQSVISLARSLAQTGNEQSAFQVFESAEQLLSQTPSPFVKIPLAQILVQHARLSTEPSNATKLYTKALDLLEPHDDPATHDHALLLSKILREVALLSLGDGNTALAKKLLVQAQDAADQTPEVTTKIDILRTRVELEKQRGKYNQAVELYREILKKAEEADDQPLVARTRMELGAMIGRMGKFEEGLENLNLAEQEFEDLEDPIRQTEVTLHKASILISRPDAWAARRLLESLTLDPILNPDLEARRLQLLAYVTVILQDVDQSNVYAKQSIELAQIVGDEQTELRAKLTLTHIMSRTPEQALRASRTLTEIVLKQKQIEDWEGLAHTYAYAARAAANGRIRGAGPTTAREMLKKAEKLYRQIGYLAEIRRLEDLQRRLGI